MVQWAETSDQSISWRDLGRDSALNTAIRISKLKASLLLDRAAHRWNPMKNPRRSFRWRRRRDFVMELCKILPASTALRTCRNRQMWVTHSHCIYMANFQRPPTKSQLSQQLQRSSVFCDTWKELLVFNWFLRLISAPICYMSMAINLMRRGFPSSLSPDWQMQTGSLIAVLANLRASIYIIKRLR